jgi:hypothetical protein
LIIVEEPLRYRRFTLICFLKQRFEQQLVSRLYLIVQPKKAQPQST